MSAAEILSGRSPNGHVGVGAWGMIGGVAQGGIVTAF
jgi:hypothetical protein